MTSYCKAILKDGKVDIKTVSGGREFHAAIELGKKSAGTAVNDIGRVQWHDCAQIDMDS